ncbi:amino acid permease [Epilithonimonas hungarica]|uniref:hypothetical protein n=1 Tax=Epilithonimonas hungarica TaxID=454006 RepID=UPI00277D3DA7|nr:hypothetical protein [Epilithonimonas hungarica]MDP9954703.1 amino acid permease [Epilithonimonas hungarica]
MEDRISAFEKITSVFQKRPIASMAVVVFIAIYICYKVVTNTYEEQLQNARKDADVCEQENRKLIYNLLIKNKIIDANKELDKVADSVIKDKTPEAVEIIKNQK